MREKTKGRKVRDTIQRAADRDKELSDMLLEQDPIEHLRVLAPHSNTATLEAIAQSRGVKLPKEIRKMANDAQPKGRTSGKKVIPEPLFVVFYQDAANKTCEDVSNAIAKYLGPNAKDYYNTASTIQRRAKSLGDGLQAFHRKPNNAPSDWVKKPILDADGNPTWKRKPIAWFADPQNKKKLNVKAAAVSTELFSTEQLGLMLDDGSIKANKQAILDHYRKQITGG